MAETLLLAAASAATTAGVAAPVYAGFGAGAALSAGATLSTIGAGSLITTGLTAASAFGSIMSGQQQAGVYKAQAVQSELAAKTEELKGRQQADTIRRSLQATLASQNAAFAARGISLASGTPVNIGNVSKSNASRDIQTAQFGAGTAAAAERGTAATQRMSASAAKTTGYTTAATSLYAGKNTFGSLIQ